MQFRINSLYPIQYVSNLHILSSHQHLSHGPHITFLVSRAGWCSVVRADGMPELCWPHSPVFCSPVTALRPPYLLHPALCKWVTWAQLGEHWERIMQPVIVEKRKFQSYFISLFDKFCAMLCRLCNIYPVSVISSLDSTRGEGCHDTGHVLRHVKWHVPGSGVSGGNDRKTELPAQPELFWNHLKNTCRRYCELCRSGI